jgi:tetratricopeptide (TPR) repeat protein
MTQIIYQAPDFLVRFVGAGRSQACVVAFSSFTDDPRLDRPGFGEGFFREKGIDAVHIINRTNVWYDYGELPEALQRIAALTAAYTRVVTYGSSMGGYAAIRYAEPAGASMAIAISPQYSISRRLVPFEKRWKSEARGKNLRSGHRHGSARVETVIFYDPHDQDLEHVRLIAQAYPRTAAVRLPHAGHPVGAFLAETRLLSGAVLDIISGSFDAAALERAARALRRGSGQYLFTLARRLPPWHMSAKLRLAAAAAAATHDAAYFIYLAKLREARGELGCAEQWLTRACETLPDHPVPLRAHCVFLLRRQRYSDAVPLCEQLLSIAPGWNAHRSLAIAALTGCGRFDAAAQVACQTEAQPKGLAPPWLRDGIGRILTLLVRLRVLSALLRAMRPLLLARLERQIRLDRDLERIEEWQQRHKRSRGRLLRRKPVRLRLHDALLRGMRI